MADTKSNKKYNEWKEQSKSLVGFSELVKTDSNLKKIVVDKYNEDSMKGWKAPMKLPTTLSTDSAAAVSIASKYAWDKGYTNDLLKRGSSQTTAKSINNTNAAGKTSDIQTSTSAPEISSSPFDRRLDRLRIEMLESKAYGKTYTPYSTEYKEVTSSGYIMNFNTLKEKLKNYTPSKDGKTAGEILKSAEDEYKRMKNDDFYHGVPALQNQYALVRLYGSKGGALLVNQKNQRRWYEVDNALDQPFNFASTPTTSALIDWGNGDPHGRTPYQFTDFVYAKYWNKIQNNRLITIRRYPAPILDNLKFPNMEKGTSFGQGGEQNQDPGSTKNTMAFAPMASAITYFGGETGNTLNNILKFTTGVLWDEVQAGIWEVTGEAPDNTKGIGSDKLFKGIGSLAEILGVTGGGTSYNTEFIMNQGQLPPDPYQDGPYENRIKGPVNRIDTVKKRKPGLDFKMDNLNIIFEYVARPVGGINPKAVLLDILSNFLVIGSASAVFFGGAHRFMSAPAKYPFVGNIKDWYEGRPAEWAKKALQQFAGEGGLGQTAFSNALASAKDFFSSLLSGDFKEAFGSIFAPGTASGNMILNAVAKKSAGQVPYLQGMKAILTGEPVGEWHITIGNPLNPIAMIGNLICEGIEVEFNEELGPDDFPTEMKITVKLKHGMARDRDAIESIFNRGMGRIYTLPDSFLGSADFQTGIDNYTQEKTQVGYAENARMNIKYQQGMDSYRLDEKQAQGSDYKMSGAVSIWNRNAFYTGISENSNVTESTNELMKSAYRSVNWIAQRSML